MEALVVMGLFSMIAGLGLFLDFGSYRGDAFRAEQASLVELLQTARANALNNINEEPHGVAIHPGGYDGYVVFEGSTYATADHSRDMRVEAFYTVGFSSTTPQEVVFEQLSGDSNGATITMTDSVRGLTAVIAINHEGAIDW